MSKYYFEITMKIGILATSATEAEDEAETIKERIEMSGRGAVNGYGIENKGKYEED